jgi:ATP-dependent DNA helicase RecG
VALDDQVEALVGVGEKKGEALRAKGVSTVRELLEYFPRRYQFESEERPIADLVHDEIQSARGEIIATNYVPRPRSRFEATLEDSTGKLALSWFNAAWLRNKVRPGVQLRVRGKVKSFRGLPQMTQAKWEEVDEETPATEDSTFRPIYAASAELSTDEIMAIVADNLAAAVANVPEFFDEKLLRKHDLPTRGEAYRLIHQPANWREALRARRRLVFDELMLLQLGLNIGRRQREGKLSAPVLRIDKTLDARIRGRFPFEMTGAQQRAVWQIAADMKSGRPMNRLLQGDVGSGKTVVALYAMLVAVANKMQAAFLAPTEVLAEQHYRNLVRMLDGSSVGIDLVTGRTKRKGRGFAGDAALDRTDLAIGTQALLQSDVAFGNLGLVVIDEQHKLGVKQRAHLRDQGHAPHYLVMTATPIPRTLALSYLSDFDVTTIDELPPGRQPIRTYHLRPKERKRAHDFIRRQVEAGRQAYVVLPQIDDDGLGETQSVRKHFDQVKNGGLKGLRLGMMHGQLSGDEKQHVMHEFRDGKLDVLVSTTVIEVGVDVPNATVMVIESSERFGLSQLHQLRGRVGRGAHDSFCILVSEAETDQAKQRIEAMCRTNDGFEIAETDLKLRGPGDFFGTRQHGLPPMKIADLTKELELLKLAKDDAAELLADDPNLLKPHHEALRAALIRQFGDALELAQVG